MGKHDFLAMLSLYIVWLWSWRNDFFFFCARLKWSGH